MERRDIGWVIGLACALTACLVVLAWPAPWAGAGDGVDAPSPLDLRTAPWAHQPDGSPTIDDVVRLPSAVFPAGVDYPDALAVIFAAARGGGTVPADVVLADPLPAEVVVVRDVAGTDRIRVSLTAPFGWVDTARLIRPASVRIPAGLPIVDRERISAHFASGAEGVPDGATIDVPRLEACQIATGTPQQRPSCD